MDEYIDMLIPRGGAGLHKLCREQSTIPVITGDWCFVTPLLTKVLI